MQILHMLWVPFVYLLAPNWLARKSLHGFLVQMGYGKGAIPVPAIHEMADQAYVTHRMVDRRYGLLKRMELLTISLSANAQLVVALIEEDDRASYFLASGHRIKDVLDRNGMETRPILRNKNAKLIDAGV